MCAHERYASARACYCSCPPELSRGPMRSHACHVFVHVCMCARGMCVCLRACMRMAFCALVCVCFGTCLYSCVLVCLRSSVCVWRLYACVCRCVRACACARACACVMCVCARECVAGLGSCHSASSTVGVGPLSLCRWAGRCAQPPWVGHPGGRWYLPPQCAGQRALSKMLLLRRGVLATTLVSHVQWIAPPPPPVSARHQWAYLAPCSCALLLSLLGLCQGGG